MAAAWIIWRTPTAVRHVWSEYRREVTAWRGLFYRRYKSGWGYGYSVAIGDGGEPSENSIPGTVIVKEYHVERLSELTLFDVLARTASTLPEDGVVVVKGSAAKSELWRSLQSGNLVAEGIPLDGSERRIVRDAEWVDLDYFDQPSWPSDAIGVSLEKRERYRSVRVRSEEVTRLWIDPRLRNVIQPPRPELPPTQSPMGGGFNAPILRRSMDRQQRWRRTIRPDRPSTLEKSLWRTTSAIGIGRYQSSGQKKRRPRISPRLQFCGVPCRLSIQRHRPRPVFLAANSI
jgi:hypothetical protein